MKKPEISVKKYLDWIHLDDYLLANGFTRDDLRALSDFWRDGGNFHNGCFVMVEHPEQYDSDSDFYPPALGRLAKFLTEEFPDAANQYGEFDIWYWW